MTEKEIRNRVVTIAKQYYGCNEADGSFTQIIDTYNSVTPLPRGYKVKYTDEWCATYVSAIGMYAGLSDIIFRECGCGEMVNLYKKAGRWVENDAYVPQAGDIIMYDWQDNGVGDNVGHPDHVGIVVSVSGNVIRIIEGNIGQAVGYRNIAVNGKNIRGYCIPNYASKATTTVVNPTTTTTSTKLKYAVGDIVNFVGKNHYVSTNSTSAKSCKSGKAKVTAVYKTGKHPYHLVAVSGGGSSVHGWVNASDIGSKVTASATTATTSTTTNNTASVKVEDAKSYNKSIYGTYKTTTNLRLRAGAGTNKAILVTIPKGESVKCYGYYTNANNVNWYYVVYKTYRGFVSSLYLTK